MDYLADKVRRERLQRGWSVRDAARAGGISNTFWGNFEDYRQALTPLLTAAVSRAFEWSDDWANAAIAERNATGTGGQSISYVSTTRFDELAARVDELELVVRELSGARLGDDPAGDTTHAARSTPAAPKPARRASKS